MNSRRLLLTAMIVLLSLGFATDGRTDISNSAVLFLRIAPGSRAAAMGEAYVAIADDATATHWNPAGLANEPLSDNWSEPQVPLQHRPLTSIASMSRGGDGYLSSDIWAIGQLGLVRFDNYKWSDGEVFGTKTDETIARKVRSYFRATDEQQLEQIQDRVAAANNAGLLEELQQFRDRLLAAVPAEHRDRLQITADLDSLLLAWRECRVEWTSVREAEARMTDGLKDSVLSDDEVTRVSLSLERSRKRFLPEEITMPYSALFASKPSVVASSGTVLLVGGADGLARFNGANWALLTVADGLPSNNITALLAVGRSILVGTDSGVVEFNGLTFEPLATESAAMPRGTVEAIGGNAMNMLVAAIDGELYRFDGQSWKNTTTYTAVLDDTPERIADKFALSKSPIERQVYLEKYRAIFESGDPAVAPMPTPDSASDTMVAPAPAADSASAAAAVTVAPGFETPINPGDMMEVPMVARVKGKVNAIYLDRLNRIWLGTEYGVFWMDDNGWHAPGYEIHVVAEGETLDILKDCRGYSPSATPHVDVLADLNDIGEGNPLEVGDTIMVTANPSATQVNAISSDGVITMFATRRGVIQYDGTEWSPANLHGVNDENVIAVSAMADNLWAASDSRIVGKGEGRFEVSLMHVNWLPELADDMYYEFLAVAGPVRGLGTLGLNLTYLTYGTILRTGSAGSDPTGDFTAYDLAVTGSYGTSLTRKLKAGLSAKLIISRLADQGAGAEKGSGTSTGFAIDFGFLYNLTPRWTWGLAVTNLGPKMAYIDAAQSDELPRNLAFGTAYKLLDSDYSKMLVTLEMNKMLVGMGDGFREELKQLVLNGGAEFCYANLLALRGGYIFDQEGDVKAFTFGAGVKPLDWVQADFSYIPSQGDSPLSNTVRFSLRLLL